MAPSPSVKVEKGIKRLQRDLSSSSENTQGNYLYYESERILGKLYREIDEDAFFYDLEGDDTSLFSREGTDDVLAEVWDFVLAKGTEVNWRDCLAEAARIKEQ